MPAETIILFDIDHTLFDAALYRDKIFAILTEKLPYSDRQVFQKSMRELYFNLRKEMNFEPTIFIDRLVKKFGMQVNQQDIENAILDQEMISTFLFSETEEVMLSLSKLPSVKLGIFSGGRSDMQRKKIKKILHLLQEENIHIILNDKQDHLPEVLKKYARKRLFVIDDVLNMLFTVKQLQMNALTVWCKRGRFALNQLPIPGFEPDFVITGLRELIPVITS